MRFIKLLSLALLSCSILIILGLMLGNIEKGLTSSPQCIHGMRIIGEKTIYLSHMPLANSNCHSYQVILEATFKGIDNPQDKYLKDQAKDPKQNEYTLEPTDKFWLPGLKSGQIKTFKANIHRGQYERNSTPQLLASNVTVEVRKVVHFSKFDPNIKRPTFMEYLLFGDISEQYLSHLIINPPDFDQILAVEQPLTSLGNTRIAKTIRLVLSDKPILDAEAVKQALKANEQFKAQINGKGANLDLKAGTEYFLETEDLKI